MLMMLADAGGLLWTKAWAADAHDAGRVACFGRRLGQLMLMMLADAGWAACSGRRIGQLMLMMLVGRPALDEGLGS